MGLEEEGANKPVIEFIQGGETKLTIDAPTFGNTPAIDTTKFADGELLIRVTAYDLAGNKGVTQETYYVNQETDKPVISNSASNINLDAKDYSDIANPYNDETDDYYNMFQRKSNLYINIDDDDGLVHTVTVDLQKYVINNDVYDIQFVFHQCTYSIRGKDIRKNRFLS